MAADTKDKVTKPIPDRYIPYDEPSIMKFPQYDIPTSILTLRPFIDLTDLLKPVYELLPEDLNQSPTNQECTEQSNFKHTEDQLEVDGDNSMRTDNASCSQESPPLLSDEEELVDIMMDTSEQQKDNNDSDIRITVIEEPEVIDLTQE